LGLDIILERVYNNFVGASVKYLLIPSIDTPVIFKRDYKRNPIDTGLSPQVFIHQLFGLYPSNFKIRHKEISIEDSSKTALPCQ